MIKITLCINYLFMNPVFSFNFKCFILFWPYLYGLFNDNFLFICFLQGWLVDLINKFGTLNGFQILHDRFMSGQALNVQIIAALIK